MSNPHLRPNMHSVTVIKTRLKLFNADIGRTIALIDTQSLSTNNVRRNYPIKNYRINCFTIIYI